MKTCPETSWSLNPQMAGWLRRSLDRQRDGELTDAGVRGDLVSPEAGQALSAPGNRAGRRAARSGNADDAHGRRQRAPRDRGQGGARRGGDAGGGQAMGHGGIESRSRKQRAGGAQGIRNASSSTTRRGKDQEEIRAATE